MPSRMRVSKSVSSWMCVLAAGGLQDASVVGYKRVV